jgi:OFA family oxalate/formate antiporter-like MFS transporter
LTAAAPSLGGVSVSDQPFFRWAQLLMGIVCMGLIANLQYGWTLFVNPMEAKNHWGLTSIQLAFSIFVVVETWLVPVEGWLVDKFGPRPVIAGGAILAALGWVMNSYATSLTELYLAAVVAGLGAGCVYGTCVGNALKWFPDKRGLAAGLTAAGFGAGAAVTVIPIANMIKASGYEYTFFYFGILQGVCIFVIALFMVRPRPPKGVLIPSRLVMTKVDYSTAQMVRTPTFWLTYVLFVAVAAGGLMATAQIGPIAKDYKLASIPISFLGFAVLPLLTMTLAIDNLANGFTRPLCGFISDKIGRENTMLIVFVGEGLSLLGLMTYGHNPYAFMTFAALRHQERRGECRHDVHGQGDGGPARSARIGLVGRWQLGSRVHGDRDDHHRRRHCGQVRLAADASALHRRRQCQRPAHRRLKPEQPACQILPRRRRRLSVSADRFRWAASCFCGMRSTRSGRLRRKRCTRPDASSRCSVIVWPITSVISRITHDSNNSLVGRCRSRNSTHIGSGKRATRAFVTHTIP